MPLPASKKSGLEEMSASAGHLGRSIASRLGRITLEKVTEIGFANAVTNAKFIAQGKSIRNLKDLPLMEGTGALIIAAGPSIHRYDTAGIIKKSGFNGIIITTESAMAYCLRNDIIPDLVVTLDPHPQRIVRWFGDPDLTKEALSKDDYYARQDMDPKFHEDQLAFNIELLNLIDRHGPQLRVAVSSSAPPAVVRRVMASGMDAYWWNPMYDDYDVEKSLTRKLYKLNGLPCVNAGGNVGSACWVFAHSVLQKKRIGLIGMDLGYYENTPYKQTQYYEHIVSLVGTERLDEVYVRIHNPHLNCEFYTDPAYLWYRDSFLEMAQQADCETINCTGGGILFGPGIQWMDLLGFLSQKT